MREPLAARRFVDRLFRRIRDVALGSAPLLCRQFRPHLFALKHPAETCEIQIDDRGGITRDNFVTVTLAMVETEFAEASQVLKIISGEIEPP